MLIMITSDNEAEFKSILYKDNVLYLLMNNPCLFPYYFFNPFSVTKNNNENNNDSWKDNNNYNDI